MKCKIPEISWHNRDPVLSIDIQPKADNTSLYRLASGGTDSHVLIWSLSFTESGELNLDVAADLTRHQRAVNVVKWSPNGELLASADDESVVFIWKQKEESENVLLDNTNENDKEIWITLKVLRGHMEDIYDLSWAPTSQFLVSGSVDNTAIIWDIQKGKSVSKLKDHKGFVQGVAWDPKNQYVATLSTDRNLRIFDIQTKKVVHRISKSLLPVSEDSDLYKKKVILYHDDTLQTFFRRLCFSPDGNFLITPAGVADYDGATNLLNTTYIYSRFSLKQPAIMIPSPDQYTVAVKCCPIIFKLRNDADPSSAVIPLPYRMIFAIASKSSVYLYDTQQKVPFGLISNIHYTRLTDVTWSSDGKVMIVSSTDGFCSIITFENGELGEEYKDLNVFEPLDPKCETKNPKTKLKENFVEISNNELENISPNNEKDVQFSIEKIPHEMVLDKDIISSDDKFESPEKRIRLATPINVRHHPRTPSSTCSIQSPNNIKSAEKLATPIAIRREPRIPVSSNTIVEEAMDAWSTNVKTPDSSTNHVFGKKTNSEKAPTSPEANSFEKNEFSSECTEDIHLVYEESIDEALNKNNEPTQTTKSASNHIDSEKQTKINVKQTSKQNNTSKEIANKICTEKTSKQKCKPGTEAEETMRTKKAENHIVEGDLSQNKESSEKMTVENDQFLQKQTQGTPEQNSIRRVILKSISTPKSKKRLLE